MELENLYKIIENENIWLVKTILKDLNGTYIRDINNCCIILNKEIKDLKLEIRTLAEELGHHFKGVIPTLPFANDYYNTQIRSINEYRAMKWIIYKFIPYKDLVDFIQSYKPNYPCELAEHFRVTEDIIDFALKIYLIAN